MGTYGYISIIAMVCYGFMLLMFLTAKRNKIVNSFLVVLVGLLFWAGGSAFMRVHLWPSYEFWYQVSLLGILLLPYAYYCFILAFGGVKKSLPGKNISGCYADLFCGKYPAWGIPGMPECGGKEWASYFCV